MVNWINAALDAPADAINTIDQNTANDQNLGWFGAIGQGVNDVVPGTPAAADPDVSGPVDAGLTVIGNAPRAAGQATGNAVGSASGGLISGAVGSGPSGWLGFAVIGLIVFLVLGGLDE